MFAQQSAKLLSGPVLNGGMFLVFFVITNLALTPHHSESIRPDSKVGDRIRRRRSDG